MGGEVGHHPAVLDGGGAVQGGLERDALVVDHHHTRHVPAGLDPLQHLVHVKVNVHICSRVCCHGLGSVIHGSR